jgi:hypothetical protein
MFFIGAWAYQTCICYPSFTPDQTCVSVGSCGSTVVAGWYCSNQSSSCLAVPIPVPPPVYATCGESKTPCGFSSGEASGSNEGGESYSTQDGNSCYGSSTHHACIEEITFDDQGNVIDVTCKKDTVGTSVPCSGTYPSLQSC